MLTGCCFKSGQLGGWDRDLEFQELGVWDFGNSCEASNGVQFSADDVEEEER